MNEFGIAPEKILKQVGKLQSMVSSVHQIELDLSDVYHDIQSIGGDVSRLMAKSLISCAVSISNEHDKLDDFAEKLGDIAQCYQSAENTITNMESSLKKNRYCCRRAGNSRGNENVTATYHAELEVPNDINVKSGYSVEDAIDDWTAQNPGRARLGHAFDPLVGSGGSMPTPAQ